MEDTEHRRRLVVSTADPTFRIEMIDIAAQPAMFPFCFDANFKMPTPSLSLKPT
ncbi:hypothetical protein [Rhizobium leucaenae]|uniref:Uncharacterized protein n=1 Tax=Rhizobium leucaenae TaxID=29450 RepID=A0A7W6ZYQ7_9HYPH|nr:hypothetical protein [Rhizobium leucaenae]MBB4571166.1 hypothetical protein [Rhizobium leucaenae]